MDGASKFVKGDAVAGIIIMLINIVGGLVIGVMQHGLSWGESLQTYTLLTIGDGIVTQVPALVISVGTGIIVTRSASDERLSIEVLRQITAFPKTLLMVGAALLGLTLMPGLPAIPALVLVAFIGAVALLARRFKRAQAEAMPEAVDGVTPEPEAAKDADPYAALVVEPIEVNLGSRWAPLVNGDGSAVMERIAAFRKLHAQELGVVLPRVLFKEMARLGPDRYEIVIDGTTCAKAEIKPDRILAIHPGGDVRSIPGEVTRDPTYGLPALWIEESQRDAAIAAKFTLVDGPTVFVTHLTEVLRREAARLLSRAETEKLLARVRQSQPTLVEEVIPTLLSVSDVQKVLQSLLREKVSIRNLEAILETLADAGRQTKDSAMLTELVRQRLAHAICQALLGDASALQVMTLDPAIESQLLHSAHARNPDGSAPSFAIDPKLAETLTSRLALQAERMMKSNLLPVLLCAPELRRHLRALSERVMPHLRVLAMTEIPNNIELRSWSVVTL